MEKDPRERSKYLPHPTEMGLSHNPNPYDQKTKGRKAHAGTRSEAEGHGPHPVTTGIKSSLPRVYTPDHDLNLPFKNCHCQIVGFDIGID